MPDIWIPGWRQHLFALRGKPYQFTHNPKGCLHSTEGGSISGALGAYAPYPPHGIYDWRTREKLQHIPLNLASYSAMDGSDDDYLIQIELVGFAGQMRDLPEQALRNIAEDVILPIEKAFGVPRVAIWHGFKDARDGISPPLATTSSPIRLSPAQLRDFSGWLGHQHLPSPDTHWDPGAIPIQRIFNYLEDDDMTPDELLNTTVQIQGPKEDAPNTGTQQSLRTILGWSDANFGGLTRRQNALDAKVTQLNSAVGTLLNAASTLATKVDALTAKIEGIETGTGYTLTDIAKAVADENARRQAD